MVVPETDSTGDDSDARIDAAIGHTPVVRLTRVVEPGMAEVWVKIEGFVAGRAGGPDKTKAEEIGPNRPGRMRQIGRYTL